MVILLADAFRPDLPARLAAFGEVTQDLARIGDAEIVIVRSRTKVDKEMIDAAHKLKYVIRGGVGVDTIDVEYAHSKGIKVDNTPEASSVAVAELAFAMMLAMPARIVDADVSMKQGKWLKKELERTELFGKTLGLVGLGRIGRELAARAKAFGMKVVAYDKLAPAGDSAEMIELDKVLSTADFISLHVPLTDETRGMINEKTIAKMKRGAFLINTCRGQVIVESDVAAALSDGRLGGYAADVYSREPPEGSPLLAAPRTLLAPHLGASTEENLTRLGDSVIHRVMTYAAAKTAPAEGAER